MSQPKVLLLEDDVAFAIDLQHALHALGCDVTMLTDGNAGVARATSDRFDVIVASAEIEGMNGFRLCNRLKKHPTARAVPIVLLWSEGSASAVESHEALRTHADRYIKKPFLPADILGPVRAFVPALARSVPPAKTSPPRPSAPLPPPPLPSHTRDAPRDAELKKRVSDLEKELAAQKARVADLLRERDGLLTKARGHAEQMAGVKAAFAEVLAAAEEERAVLGGKIAALTSELAKRRASPKG